MSATKIHGAYYDLTHFDHPGGATPLWHAYGRDASALFEVHHPFVSKQRLHKLLEKFRIAKLPAGVSLMDGEEEAPQFNWDTPFSTELRKSVRQHFEGEASRRGVTISTATKATPSRWLQLALLTTLRIVSFWFWLRGNWAALVIFAVCDWLGSVNSFHDATHFALCSTPIFNTLWSYSALQFTSPFSWYHQHNIGHHMYSNIEGRDPDLYHATYICRKVESTSWTNIHAFQSLSVVLEWALEFLASLVVSPVKYLKSGKLFNFLSVHSSSWSYFADRAAYLFLYFILPFVVIPHSLATKLCFVFFPRILHSLFFMLNSQITHIHTESLGLKEEKDWYKHQVIASTNHGVRHWWHFFASGGLNHQIEHHLFPGVDHGHLRALQPLVQRVCAKHGVPYKSFSGYWEAFQGYYRHIVRMSKPRAD